MCSSVVAPSMLTATIFRCLLTETICYNDPTAIHIDSQLRWHNNLFSSQLLYQVLFCTLYMENVIFRRYLYFHVKLKDKIGDNVLYLV